MPVPVAGSFFSPQPLANHFSPHSSSGASSPSHSVPASQQQSQSHSHSRSQSLTPAEQHMRAQGGHAEGQQEGEQIDGLSQQQHPHDYEEKKEVSSHSQQMLLQNGYHGHGHSDSFFSAPFAPATVIGAHANAMGMSLHPPAASADPLLSRLESGPGAAAPGGPSMNGALSSSQSSLSAAAQVHPLSSPSAAAASSALQAGAVYQSAAVSLPKDAPRLTLVDGVRVFGATEAVRAHSRALLVRAEPASALLTSKLIGGLCGNFGSLQLFSLHVARLGGPAALVQFQTGEAAREAVAVLNNLQLQLTRHDDGAGAGSEPGVPAAPSVVTLRLEFVRDDGPGRPALQMIPRISAVVMGKPQQQQVQQPANQQLQHSSFQGLPGAEFVSPRLSPHYF
jgi:hypothetical protein